MTRLLIAFSIFGLVSAPRNLAQQVQTRGGTFLVLLREAESDVSPAGKNLRSCAMIYPDGRFHLEQRFQQLPSSTATLKVFESSLDSSELQQLEAILNDETIRKMPSLVQPSVPTSATRFRGFTAAIDRGDGQLQNAGYFIFQPETSGKSSSAAPDELKLLWKQSEAALRPLLQWFHHVQSTRLVASDEKSTLCNADVDQ